MVGKSHPDLFTLINELKKEQANTKVSLVELSLGRRVKNSPAQKWTDLQDRLRSTIVEYVETNTELDYLRTLGHTIQLS
jgi:hypothetical protein